MKALSRNTRDTISLVLKCFSAHTYFINSKIISKINKEDDLTVLSPSKRAPKTETDTTISEVLLELEFVKRELYNQILFTRELETDKKKITDEYGKLEEEMALTIESYQQILEGLQTDEGTDIVKIKKEMITMQKQIEELESERSQLND